MKAVKVYGDSKVVGANGTEIESPFFIGQNGAETVVFSEDLKQHLYGHNSKIVLEDGEETSLGEEYVFQAESASAGDWAEIELNESSDYEIVG